MRFFFTTGFHFLIDILFSSYCSCGLWFARYRGDNFCLQSWCAARLSIVFAGFWWDTRLAACHFVFELLGINLQFALIFDWDWNLVLQLRQASVASFLSDLFRFLYMLILCILVLMRKFYRALFIPICNLYYLPIQFCNLYCLELRFNNEGEWIKGACPHFSPSPPPPREYYETRNYGQYYIY